ncbi:cytochrome P450 [Stipitochalara longipes BDJ]|nr:cytochrome P450 [Stipitochalara longipes BDJ]
MVGLREIAVVILSCILAPIILLSIYRLALHPYAKYPGPLLGKLTSLRAAYYAHNGDMHLDIERCHQKYGKFVRYRPNAIVVNSAEAYQDIYGTGKKVKKAHSYTVHGLTNLIGIQDKKEYAKQKKIMQPGFSDSANREHEPTMIRTIGTFIEKISENETPEKSTDGWTNPKNMTLWCNYLTTDVISKVVFTTSWDLLTSTTNHGITETFKAIVRLTGVLHQWPTAYHELTASLFLPHLAWSSLSLKKFSLAVMSRRYDMGQKDPSIKDVFGLFSSARDPDTGELALAPLDVRRNTGNFIVAGSDTTASSISASFFYLARNPTAYAKVAQEVRSAFPSVSDIRAGPALNNCVYLRAAVNESLRMAPVATQPLWREVDSGGCIVDGEQIPEGYNVGAGIFSLHRRAEAFPNPYKWDLERWIVDPKKDEEAEKERIREMSRSFAPFSIGPRQCIAKNFAMMELTLTMANVFYQLDFESAGTLGEGKKGAGWGREREGEFQFKSYFTSYMDGPLIRFKKREL